VWCCVLLGWKEDSHADVGEKIKHLRKAYQRAVVLPLDGVEDLWKVRSTKERKKRNSLSICGTICKAYQRVVMVSLDGVEDLWKVR
jgi:hypothetical protein